MRVQDRANFNNICDDALKLISDASRSIRDLAEYQRNNPEMVKSYYHEVNEKCINTIFSMLDEKDKLNGDIYHFDVISFLKKIGVISGNYRKLKKSPREKVDIFCREIHRYQVSDAIEMLLVIKRALLNTGCIVEDEGTCILHRKYEYDVLFSDVINRKMRERTIGYEIYQAPDSNAVPNESTRSGKVGSISNPLSGGGWSPR